MNFDKIADQISRVVLGKENQIQLANLDIIKGTKPRINVQIQAASRGLLRPWPLLVYSDYIIRSFKTTSESTSSSE